MTLADLGVLLTTPAPIGGGLVVLAVALVWIARVVRTELHEERASRERTATVGTRVGDLENDVVDLYRANEHLLSLITAVSASRPPVPHPPPAAVPPAELDETSRHLPIPPLPEFPKHHRSRP